MGDERERDDDDDEDLPTLTFNDLVQLSSDVSDVTSRKSQDSTK